MKTAYGVLLLSCVCMTAAAQSERDSSDIYYQHLNLNEVVVSSPVGQMKRKQSATPISVVTPKRLRQTASTNIVDAIARQPGIAQITTGSGISKPVIRGLGYNRIVCIADGVRQEGQQWGDEHGIELDGASVGQVEIQKGPASLMYGSDAMAGVVIFQPEAIAPEGQVDASASTEYQTNSGLFSYSLRLGGNKRGFVWNARYSEKMAHAYKNKYDGYVPGTQFHERAVKGLLGVNRTWGFSHLTLGYYHVTPSMTEGERDAVTGQLVSESDDVKTYRKTAPFQQVRHYKAVLDISVVLGNGVLKAVVGYQQNRRQEYEEPDEAELDFRLHTLTYDARYVYGGWDGWKLTGGAGGMWQRSLNEGEEALIPAYRLLDFGAYVTASRELKRWTLSGGVRFDSRSLRSFQRGETAPNGAGTTAGGAGTAEAKGAGTAAKGTGTAAGGARAAAAGGTDEGADEEMRFEGFRRSFGTVTGSIGAVYHATPRMNVRFNVARGFRAPNLSELGSNGVHEGTLRYEKGNKDLKAEHSWQADLGMDFSGRYVSVEAALFLNRIENYIYAARVAPADAGLSDEETEGFRTFRYTQGDAVLKGFEVGIDVHPIHQLHIGSTFSMVDARQLHQPKETRYLPLTPAPRWTAEVKWEFVHNGDHHTTGGHHVRESAHHHRLDHILDNAFVSIGIDHSFRQKHYYMADETETATPAYTLLSATVGTDILLRGKRKLCEVYVIGENLLNTAYQSHLSRLKYADTNNVTGRRGIFNPGRNVTFKVVFPLTF